MKIDETLQFTPNYNQDGLIPCVVSSFETREVLMVAYMNEETLRLSLQTGEAHYWSRSRGEIWHKGATSGNTQIIRSMQLDCDQDCVFMKVEMPKGKNGEISACHTGRRSCFYRELTLSPEGEIRLIKND
jgi:phosphoribosyl-AMP cyclohydrolase